MGAAGEGERAPRGSSTVAVIRDGICRGDAAAQHGRSGGRAHGRGLTDAILDLISEMRAGLDFSRAARSARALGCGRARAR